MGRMTKEEKEASRVFASMGGKARAKKTSKAQRQEWGKRGAMKRWGDKDK